MASTSFNAVPPPVFSGENYPVWAVKMKTYLKAYDLWDVVETNRDPSPLNNNPTVAQLKHHGEEVAKKFKALSCLQSAVTDVIFTRIMACENAKEAWDKLQEEFQGSSKMRQMQILNLRREFELLRMKESESVKEFADRLMKVVNQIRLFGEELTDKRIVEKVLVSLPEKYESKISSLEDSKDLSTVTPAELICAFQAQEQRRTIRQEEAVETALMVTQKPKSESKNTDGRKDRKEYQRNKPAGRKYKYGPCENCKKPGHSTNFCWFRPGVKCRTCKQFGHVERVCKNRAESQAQQAQKAEVQEQQEEKLFAAICYTVRHEPDEWLIDSACSNHMTSDSNLFFEMDRNYRNRVKIGNGEYLQVLGFGKVAVQTTSGMKFIPNVMYAPNICNNLLSLGQMVEEQYQLHFKDMKCTVIDPKGKDLLVVKMKDRCFPVSWNKTEHKAHVVTLDDSEL